MWIQKNLTLEPQPRGFHLITADIVNVLHELPRVKTGLLHVFIQHSSASLTINENADPSVRVDFETCLNHLIPENTNWFTHRMEGADDMPAHIKSSLMGNSITVPVTHGHLALGTWQGIYLCEHRNHGGRRHLVLTLHGESA